MRFVVKHPLDIRLYPDWFRINLTKIKYCSRAQLRSTPYRQASVTEVIDFTVGQRPQSGAPLVSKFGNRGEKNAVF